MEEIFKAPAIRDGEISPTLCITSKASKRPIICPKIPNKKAKLPIKRMTSFCLLILAPGFSLLLKCTSNRIARTITAIHMIKIGIMKVGPPSNKCLNTIIKSFSVNNTNNITTSLSTGKIYSAKVHYSVTDNK